MADWLTLAIQPTVVRRALKFALVVGAILITINHGYAIVHGQVTSGRIWQMCLTVLVPYTVSTLSSVGAMREMARKERVG
ncbi:MAG TPA: nitrate/nitrite transporter NrtS, partial [Tepidisphaeraceae bacterium]|nr:nitrate/nitrite transporter NrtS [Tepidisphaeraceae bacterium]